MSLDSIPAFVATVRRYRLLEPLQLEELNRAVQARFSEPRALAQELVQRGWLTPYQVNQVFMERGQDLLLGSYVLLERLGEGGMGAVFKARNWKLGHVVALKLIRKERLANPESLRRFQREVRAAAQLNHPNIVRAFDADNVGGTHLLVMECIEGTDLAGLVKKNGPLPLAQACDCIRQAALGLQHAHERGLVHRDIKPHNLLLTDKGSVVKVLDMGLARLTRQAEGEATSTLTQEGAVMDTPDYMAPEQTVDSHTADIRADLYSLGCTFYHLLTGQVPFPGGTLGEKIARHLSREPTPVEKLRPDTFPAVAAMVRKLMAKRPEDRYQTPAELAAALAAMLADNQQPRAGRPVAPQEDHSSAKAVATSTASRAAFAGLGGDTELAADSPFVQRRKAQRRRFLLLNLAGTCVLLVLLTVFVILLRSQSTAKPTEEKPPLVKTQKPPPAADQPNSLGMRFVCVPRGSFWMGGGGGNPGTRQVEIPAAFSLGIHEVTQGQWKAVMGENNPSYFSRSGGGKDAVKDIPDAELEQFPVETVSWEDAQAFIKRLNVLEKDGAWLYRLPTEAEWEYACREGASSKEACSFDFYLDQPTNDLSSEQANFHGNYPVGKAAKGKYLARVAKVGSYQPNRLGIYDMHGNLWEWCEDAFDGGPDRVIRGGSWFYYGFGCRAVFRSRSAPSTRDYTQGFRLARVPSGNK